MCSSVTIVRPVSFKISEHLFDSQDVSVTTVVDNSTFVASLPITEVEVSSALESEDVKPVLVTTEPLELVEFKFVMFLVQEGQSVAVVIDLFVIVEVALVCFPSELVADTEETEKETVSAGAKEVGSVVAGSDEVAVLVTVAAAAAACSNSAEAEAGIYQ